MPCLLLCPLVFVILLSPSRLEVNFDNSATFFLLGRCLVPHTSCGLPEVVCLLFSHYKSHPLLPLATHRRFQQLSQRSVTKEVNFLLYLIM